MICHRHRFSAQMDLMKAGSTITLDEHDGLMAVLPVFAGRVPQIALERLSALKGNGQKAVAVVVYGNREYDDALLETRDVLEGIVLDTCYTGKAFAGPERVTTAPRTMCCLCIRVVLVDCLRRSGKSDETTKAKPCPSWTGLLQFVDSMGHEQVIPPISFATI